MADFDEQWKKVMGSEYFEKNQGQFDFSETRVEEFRNLTGVSKNGLKDKICLDAGCGPGRWTYAMQKLGADKVDSFDVSFEAVSKCNVINQNAFQKDIFELEPNPIYDLVVSWGVLHHTKNTRDAFSKVVSQVKDGGMLHVMIYDKNFDGDYDGYRGDSCVEKHKEWENLSFEEKIQVCKDKVEKVGGDVHGWFDAFNPEYNWSFSPDEIKKWFEEEGFGKIKLRVKSHFNSIPTSQVNMNGIKLG